MPLLPTVWSRFLPFKRPPSIDRFHVSVVTSAAELEFAETLPIEIRYILAVRPSRHEAFHKLLEQGFGLGVRTVDKTPERVLEAVDRISHHTQRNTIMPWLGHLLRDETLPSFSEEDLRAAEAQGWNLYEEARMIIAQRFEFKKIILVPLHNQPPTELEQALIREVNEDLYPHAIEVVINRVTFDNAHTRTEVARTIVKALLIIGPIAHVLERLLSGIGKLFAATADDLLSGAAELFALRGSGFTWRQLTRRSHILVLVFLGTVYGAFQVEPLIRSGHPGWAGAVFGLSASALSLTSAIQSIGMYRRAYAALAAEGKLRLVAGESLYLHAVRQDFTNPVRFGLFVGAIVSPCLAAIVFAFFSDLARNGWVLALLGSTESFVASLTVIAAGRINRLLFRSRVRRAILKTVSRP